MPSIENSKGILRQKNLLTLRLGRVSLGPWVYFTAAGRPRSYVHQLVKPDAVLYLLSVCPVL